MPTGALYAIGDDVCEYRIFPTLFGELIFCEQFIASTILTATSSECTKLLSHIFWDIGL